MPSKSQIKQGTVELSKKDQKKYNEWLINDEKISADLNELEKLSSEYDHIKEMASLTLNLSNIVKTFKTFKNKNSRAELDDLKKKHDFAKNKQKEVKKDKNKSKEDKDKEVKMTQLYLKAVNASTKAVSAIISAYLKELTGHYKLSYTLLTKAGKYLEKKTGTEAVKQPGKVESEIVDDGTPKRAESKEDAEKIRQASTDGDFKENSYLYDNDYIDAVLEAELYEYNL